MDLWSISDLCTPWCVHVAVTLGVAGQIAAGVERIDALANAVGADAGALGRLLRHLAGQGIFEEPEPGRFLLNGPARMLLSDAARVGLDLNGFGGRMARAWQTLLPAVKTGRPAYHEVFGRGWWEDLDAHPDIAANFDAAMGPEGHGVPDPEVLLNPADWESVRTVVDVGGGSGALLAEVLRAHRKIEGTLVDLPRTVAQSPEIFAGAGVTQRATAIGQSFFDPLPAGRDLYLLKSILHDWPDAEAAAILKRCAEAATPSGRVVAVNGVTGADRAAPDLLMLVLVGGKERTLEEFRALAHLAGLTISSAGPNPSGRFQVECRPVASVSSE